MCSDPTAESVSRNGGGSSTQRWGLEQSSLSPTGRRTLFLLLVSLFSLPLLGTRPFYKGGNSGKDIVLTVLYYSKYVRFVIFHTMAYQSAPSPKYVSCAAWLCRKYRSRTFFCKYSASPSKLNILHTIEHYSNSVYFIQKKCFRCLTDLVVPCVPF